MEHEGISALTFTGETRTGSAIMARAAERIKKVSFELGGKNPAIVFPEADLDRAVAGTLRSVFANCGQVCLCSERVYVHRSIFEEFVERLAAGAQAAAHGRSVGRGHDDGPADLGRAPRQGPELL